MDYTRTSRLALLTSIVILTSACQSVIHGLSQDVTFETDPAGATITLSDGRRCVSPCSLEIDRYQEVDVTASKPNCRNAGGRLTTSVRDDTILTSIFDYQLGGAYDIVPSPMTLSLICGEAAKWETPHLTPQDEQLLEQFGRPIAGPPEFRSRGPALPPPDLFGFPRTNH